MSIVHVKYCRNGDIVPMGRLAYAEKRIFFEYAPSFLESGLQLSPFKLPLQPGVIACTDFVFDGLFGLFNDSLPDGWGRFLLDRKLMKMGMNPRDLTSLDRLRFVGRHGMGALQYEPEMEAQKVDLEVIQDLDAIARECFEVQELENDEHVDELFLLNGSSAGARPKIMVRILAQNRGFACTKTSPKEPHNDWLIKFRSSADPKDIGSIEYAYHLMAKSAGLDVPDAKLFKSKTCPGYFGVKRFDRLENTFLHMHSVSGLLHADYRIPCLDYETILKATLWLTRDMQECEKQFSQAAFNVFAHNRDDHAKNFSFLMNEQGIWRVSPAYDLTFSMGPNGEHCTTVMREGKNPCTQHLLKLATAIGIKEANALEHIEQVKDAVSRWEYFAKQAHVSAKSTKLIHSQLTTA